MIKIVMKRKRRHIVRLRNVWTPRRTQPRRLGNVLEATATPRRRSGRSGRWDLPLATGGSRGVSLTLSLIHVRAPGSITVYQRALSRVYRPAWPDLEGRP